MVLIFSLFAQIILFHIFFAFTLEFCALVYPITSAKTCLLYSLSPFIAALFSYWWFNERMTVKKMVGLCIGFAGFLPILLTSTSAENNGVAFVFFSMPELMLIGAVISATYGWIVVRMLIKNYHYSPLLINGVGMLGGGILSLLASIVVEGYTTSPVFAPQHFIIVLLAQIIVASIICYNAYGFLLRFYTATFLSFCGFLCPLFAAFFGWLFLGETVGVSFFITTGTVLLGLYLVYQEELRQGYLK